MQPKIASYMLSIIQNKSFLLSLLVTTCIAVSNFSTAKAQLFPNTANQDQVSRMQDRQLQQQKIQQERAAIKRKKLIKKRKLKAIKRQKSLIEKCFKIEKFEFNQNKIISESELKSITSKYLGKCFSSQAIDEIKKETLKLINKKGYITSQFLIPNQNLASGIVIINISPGKINKLILNNDNLGDKIQKFMLFGNLNEEILNIENINQGLHQMNSLPSSNAKIKIMPSIREEYSDVIISNEENGHPIRGNISYDNLGNDFTGVRRATFSSSMDNILSLSESINLSFTNNISDNNNKKEMESVSSSISVPFRYHRLSYSYSDTDYMGKRPAENGTYTIDGYSRRKNISLERSIINKQSHSLNISSSLTLKDTGSVTTLTSVVNSSRKKLSVLDLSASFSKSSNLFNLYLKSSILQGLKQFNADKKSENIIANDQAKNQYRAYKIYFNITKPIKLNFINSKMVLSSEFDSQLSEDNLHGSEQFSVGGNYSVRGFRENFISGDHGYYSRNKASFNLGSLLSPSLNKAFTNNKISKISSKLYNISIEPFFDYGAIRDKTNSNGGRLSGAGISTIYNSRYFNTSLTYSKVLSESKLIDSDVKESNMIYFQLTGKCC